MGQVNYLNYFRSNYQREKTDKFLRELVLLRTFTRKHDSSGLISIPQRKGKKEKSEM